MNANFVPHYNNLPWPTPPISTFTQEKCFPQEEITFSAAEHPFPFSNCINLDHLFNTSLRRSSQHLLSYFQFLANFCMLFGYKSSAFVSFAQWWRCEEKVLVWQRSSSFFEWWNTEHWTENWARQVHLVTQCSIEWNYFASIYFTIIVWYACLYLVSFNVTRRHPRNFKESFIWFNPKPALTLQHWNYSGPKSGFDQSIIKITFMAIHQSYDKCFCQWAGYSECNGILQIHVNGPPGWADKNPWLFHDQIQIVHDLFSKKA